MVDDREEFFQFSDLEPDEELSRVFKRNPSIENYLKLRREHPGREIEVAVTGGIDWLFSNEQLVRDNGIDPQLIASVLDADSEALSKLSLMLLEKLVEREDLIAAGETHVASRGKSITDSLVNHLVALMFDALSWNDDLHIPRDLIILVRHQLCGPVTAITKHQKSNELKNNVKWIGAQLLEKGEALSTRKVASILDVNASTDIPQMNRIRSRTLA